MYAYKCYYHPKLEGAKTCKGCKLPICGTCESKLGFCPECMHRRDAVKQLREMRGAIADKAKLAGSTTARLRLALRQGLAGKPAESQVTVAPPMPKPVAASVDDDWQATAMAVSARPSPSKKTGARRRATAPLWKYDPDRIAYRAPENLGAVQGRHRATPKAEARPARATTTTVAPVGFKRFLAGLFVGVFVLVCWLVMQGGHVTVRKPKSKPLYSPLSHNEQTFMSATLAEAKAREKARMIDLPAVDDVAPAQANAEPSLPTFTAPVARTAPTPVYYAPQRTVVARAIVVAPARRPVRARAPVFIAGYAGAALSGGRHRLSLADAMHFSVAPVSARSRRARGTETAHW